MIGIVLFAIVFICFCIAGLYTVRALIRRKNTYLRNNCYYHHPDISRVSGNITPRKNLPSRTMQNQEHSLFFKNQNEEILRQTYQQQVNNTENLYHDR